MATIDLGKIRFNWQGAYNNSTAYVINDVVSSGGNSYICKLASTGNAVSNGTYWDLMSQAGTNGTNGTDVGTVITTQGDVLYRDGSGLQKLAAGTSGQFLKTQGTGANPVWAEAGGGAWTVISSTVVTSAVSGITLTGIDSTVYQTHVLSIADLVATSNQQTLQMRGGSSAGGLYTGNNYNFHIRTFAGGQDAVYGSGSDIRAYGGTNHIKLCHNTNLSHEGAYNCIMYINDNATDGRSRPQFHGTFNMWHHTTNHHAGGHFSASIKDLHGGGHRLDHIMISTQSATIDKGRLTLYGIKHT